MPRSRGSEMSQAQQQQQQMRQSPRAHLRLKTTSSDSNGVHPQHRVSPKLDDSHRRSPRSPLWESSSRNQRKGGSRAAELETKLGRAQEELRKLREQLVSAEAAKRDALQELEDAKKLIPANPSTTGEQQEAEEQHDSCLVTQRSTPEREEDATEITAPAAPAETLSEKVEKKDIELEAKLAEKLEELELCSSENSALRKQLAEAEAEAGASRAREEEAASKLRQATEELAQNKARAAQLEEQLGAPEGANGALEAEMRRLRVQTEQWRKAADAAAAVLSGTEANMRKVAERCPSMDRHLGVGYDGLGSPLEEGLRKGRRKGAGIRVLGDLWKKKRQQHK